MPTGIGKSFVAIGIISMFSDRKILFRKLKSGSEQ